MKSSQPYSIHVIGDKILRTPAAPIVEITDEIRNMAQRMIATMFAFNGIGLAAPQVGISLRLVTLGYRPAAMATLPERRRCWRRCRWF